MGRNNMQKKIGIAILMVLMMNHLTLAITHTYKKTIKKGEIKPDSFIISEKELENGGFHIVLKSEDATELTGVYTNTDYNTKKMQFKNTKINTEYYAERDINYISLKGKVKGKEIEKELTIDKELFAGLIFFQVRNLVISKNNKKFSCWVIGNQDGKAYQFNFKKEKKETIDVAGKKQEVYRYKATVKGAPAFLWSARYYFKASDGLGVKYDGPSGGPGSPKLLIELVNIEG